MNSVYNRKAYGSRDKQAAAFRKRNTRCQHAYSTDLDALERVLGPILLREPLREMTLPETQGLAAPKPRHLVCRFFFCVFLPFPFTEEQRAWLLNTDANSIQGAPSNLVYTMPLQEIRRSYRPVPFISHQEEKIISKRGYTPTLAERTQK